MTGFVRKFVSKLDDEDILRMIKDYEKLEKEGAIGDCFLREAAKHIIIDLGAEDHQVVTWMERIMFEIFRRLAYEYLDVKCARLN